jgi:Zn-dependent protease
VVAQAFGLSVKQIMLFPIGGIAELEGKAKRPMHELLIAFAGPLVNIVIAVGLFVVMATARHFGLLADTSFASLAPSTATLLGVVLIGNVILAGFNLLPFFPLDGGRMLRAVLAARLGEVQSTRVAATIGQAGAFAIGLAALFMGHFFLLAISVFLFLSATAARAQAGVPELLGSIVAKDACERGPVVLLPGATLQEALASSMTTTQTVFPVALGARLLGVVTRAELEAAARRGENPYVAGLMQRSWVDVDGGAPLDLVLSTLRGASSGVAAVREGDGLLGFVTIEHVVRNVLPLARMRATPTPPLRRPSQTLA